MTIFKPGELRIILLVILGITILAVIGALIFSIVRNPEAAVTEAAPVVKEEEVRFSDFILDGETGMEDFGFKPARPVKERWSREEIESFWKDPGEAGLEKLSADNDDFIRRYFDAVP